MDNLFAQSTFFHKPTMQVFFLEMVNPEQAVMVFAPVTESGTVLWESQERCSEDFEKSELGNLLFLALTNGWT